MCCSRLVPQVAVPFNLRSACLCLPSTVTYFNRRKWSISKGYLPVMGYPAKEANKFKRRKKTSRIEEKKARKSF